MHTREARSTDESNRDSMPLMMARRRSSSEGACADWHGQVMTQVGRKATCRAPLRLVGKSFTDASCAGLTLAWWRSTDGKADSDIAFGHARGLPNTLKANHTPIERRTETPADARQAVKMGKRPCLVKRESGADQAITMLVDPNQIAALEVPGSDCSGTCKGGDTDAFEARRSGAPRSVWVRPSGPGLRLGGAGVIRSGAIDRSIDAGWCARKNRQIWESDQDTLTAART